MAQQNVDERPAWVFRVTIRQARETQFRNAGSELAALNADEARALLDMIDTISFPDRAIAR